MAGKGVLIWKEEMDHSFVLYMVKTCLKHTMSTKMHFNLLYNSLNIFCGFVNG